VVIGKLIFLNNINKKKTFGSKKHQQMFCKSCSNSTNVVTPSANIGNSIIIPNGSHNTINTDISMNEENKKALKILIEKGGDEAVKHMFNPTGEKQLSYAEMRERYG